MPDNQKKIVTAVLFGALFVAVIVGWDPLMNLIWPVKPRPPQPKQEPVILALGGMAAGVKEVAILKRDGKLPQPEVEAPKEEPKKEAEAPKLEAAQPAVEPGELIAAGHGDRPYYLQVLFNTQGGSVQQIILSEFKEANREGLEAKKPDGTPKLLHLVPGVKFAHLPTIRQQTIYDSLIPELHEGPTDQQQAPLAEPSFLLFHYDPYGDNRPVLTLGNKKWNYLKDQSDLDPAKDEQKVVFQTELGEPHNLRITKTFTLKRNEYHIGLKVQFQRLEGKSGPNQFRYQLTGAHGLPIEGEWYTTTYRNAMMGSSEIGRPDDEAATSRQFADAASIRHTEGTDKWGRGNQRIDYAAIGTQYFASAIAVDNEQANRNFLAWVRATPVDKNPPERPPERGRKPQDGYFDFLDDITVRAVSEPFDPGENVSHQFVLYHGPIKVRLLREFAKQKAVDDALIDRYLDNLHLGTMTDSPSPSAIGRFANALYWTDIVITFTNVVHFLLWKLNQVIPNLGICILLLTLMVRGSLFPFSRRQTANSQVMQAKMAKLQPELKKLKEKYASDPSKLHMETMRFYKEHGVNPFAMMGGCVLLLFQMPILMGLYYALQESVFFRLDTFLWIQNLAAPDMLKYWGEQIPYISDPVSLGSTFYLGPYFNVLPVVAVSLMLYQQIKMMPKSDDPQIKSQQQMMKMMMIVMALFFYKVAAGLCLYFIASTLWGLTERNLLPKPKVRDGPDDSGSPNDPSAAAKRDQEELPAQPPGWLGRKKLAWKAKWEELLEQAQKQQEFRRDQSQQPPDKGGGGGKKKKKRK